VEDIFDNGAYFRRYIDMGIGAEPAGTVNINIMEAVLGTLIELDLNIQKEPFLNNYPEIPLFTSLGIE
jgi:hypothetical protein